MKQARLPLLLLVLAILHEPVWPGGWGRVYAIEISGDSLTEALVITDEYLVESLSFWVGPGTSYREFMGPVRLDRSIVDWDRGEALDHPDGLTRYKVRFLLEPRDDPPAFTVFYEPDFVHGEGYIYYPFTNSIVTHSSEGTWRYASTRWSQEVGLLLAGHIRHLYTQ